MVLAINPSFLFRAYICTNKIVSVEFTKLFKALRELIFTIMLELLQMVFNLIFKLISNGNNQLIQVFKLVFEGVYI